MIFGLQNMQVTPDEIQQRPADALIAEALDVSRDRLEPPPPPVPSDDFGTAIREGGRTRTRKPRTRGLGR